jgi:hypothetical protein
MSAAAIDVGRYREAGLYLVESNRQGRVDWLAAIDKIEALHPRPVIVGHGPLDPGSLKRMGD